MVNKQCFFLTIIKIPVNLIFYEFVFQMFKKIKC